MLNIFRTNSFKKDFKKAERQGKPIKLLKEIIVKLANEETLAKKLKDHTLIGNFQGYRECHIQADWLLIYKVEDDTLSLVRLGSHSDLF